MTAQHSNNLFPLWSDDPADTDLLAFDAVANTAISALLDDGLDPVAIGLSGSWGSGKTTVLGLIASGLKEQNTDDSKIMVINTDPWRYDPATGAKESLIAEVLGALKQELETKGGLGAETGKLLSRLSKRVDWAKAIRLTAKATVALQVPSFEELLSIVKDAPDSDDQVRGLEAFRDEFSQLMQSKELNHVKRVVILVDDLDRCLPETVIETLEAIRLFLAVPKMSFVLAADEERVAEAIATRFPKSISTTDGNSEALPAEEPAKLYLHKIVQTTIPVPALSRFDTQTFIFLLLMMSRLDDPQFRKLVSDCGELRRKSKDLDDLQDLDNLGGAKDLTFAARVTPLLYEKLRGNPRRIKRFLNDLHVRQSIAANRGIALEAEVIAKLMILEVLLNNEFKRVLEWLAHGELRSNIQALESEAGQNKAALKEKDVKQTKEVPNQQLRAPARSMLDIRVSGHNAH
jgi:hypothetical protein